MNLLHMHELDM